jgi:hypothetical protein
MESVECHLSGGYANGLRGETANCFARGGHGFEVAIFDVLEQEMEVGFGEVVDFDQQL